MPKQRLAVEQQEIDHPSARLPPGDKRDRQRPGADPVGARAEEAERCDPGGRNEGEDRRGEHGEAREPEQQAPWPGGMQAPLAHAGEGKGRHDEVAHDAPRRDRQAQEHRIGGECNRLAVDALAHRTHRVIARIGVDEDVDARELGRHGSAHDAQESEDVHEPARHVRRIHGGHGELAGDLFGRGAVVGAGWVVRRRGVAVLHGRARG